MITREYDGLAGAGGVKDVVRQLGEALALAGHRVSVVLPLYGFMNPEALGFAPANLHFDVGMNYVGVERRELARVLVRHLAAPPPRSKDQSLRPVASLPQNGRKGSLSLYLLDAQRYQEKQGVYTYTAAEEALNHHHHQGSGHFDYFAMNVLLQKGALALMMRLNARPQVIHCHDGHTALLPAMIRELEGFRHYFAASAAVVTVHNAGTGYHQEVDDLPFAEAITGLPPRVIHDNLLDGAFDPFLAAASYAPLNTVSENYARELQQTDDDALTGWLGHRLLGRGITLHGITNGINPEDFNPEEPANLGLPAAFSPLQGDLAGKAVCRSRLVDDLAADRWPGLRRAGYLDQDPQAAPPPADGPASGLPLPLFTFVGRLTAQKGVDKLLGALETLLPLDRGFQVLILGSGDKGCEQALVRLAEAESNRGRLCFLQGYDPLVANQVFAAGDFFLIPSRYEPCGLTDYMAQLLGNLPIVHHVGGLVKVVDGVTGLCYREHKSAALMGAMQRALTLFRRQPEKVLDMRRAAVQHIGEHYTWNRVMHQYLDFYQQAHKQL
ncbi:glycogen synthase [Desulfurivibrio alkaliphilus]|uniref:starch synthase n=1 Tax=Desulfurivibrio alkaliphilus (strain DSM 19089 / UNIQEM U267 / AHT2) TaxID=589865 RepID=D6Z5M8_DESAT|nr:Starch synthase catalytic domain protein [Desulfurivibrio alkaliphilus AHT 2]